MTWALAPIVALLEVVTQLTATAAAIPTPLPPFDSPPDLLLDVLFASLTLSFDFGSVPVCPDVFGLSAACLFAFVSASSSLLLEPLALAFASALLVSVDAAVIATEDPWTFRSTAAVVVQPRTMTMATSAPMAALLPAASAFAVVFDRSSVCVAVTVTAPLAVRLVPEMPRRAVTELSLSSTSATAGVMAVPPSVPASTVVSTVRIPEAVTVIVVPLVSPSPAPSSASARTTVGIRMLSATTAPMPTALPTSALPLAFAVSFSSLTALRVRAPPVSVTFAPLATTASVWWATMLRASAPAMPTEDDLLAPAYASALMTCCVLPDTFRIEASTSRPVALIVADPVLARLVTSTELMATPAPTPTLPSTAVSPFAFALASVLADVLSVTAPLSERTMEPFDRLAVDEVVMKLIAKAPATLTEAPPPSLVAAFGVSVFDVVLPVLSLCLAFESLRFLSAFLFTSLPSSFAPFADASASVVDETLPSASNEIGPLAWRSRWLLAATDSSMTASPSESATPTLVGLEMAPLAEVVAVTPWSAFASILPPMPAEGKVPPMPGPRPMEAPVDRVATKIATFGLIVTVAPAAPPSAVVVRTSVWRARIVMSRTPVTVAPWLGSVTSWRPACVAS